jgi:hypothetical protein
MTKTSWKMSAEQAAALDAAQIKDSGRPLPELELPEAAMFGSWKKTTPEDAQKSFINQIESFRFIRGTDGQTAGVAIKLGTLEVAYEWTDEAKRVEYEQAKEEGKALCQEYKEKLGECAPDQRLLLVSECTMKAMPNIKKCAELFAEFTRPMLKPVDGECPCDCEAQTPLILDPCLSQSGKAKE